MNDRRLIENHFFLLSANDIENICKPLLKLGITCFTYIKNFNDGSQVYLSNSARWIDDYYNLALYKTSLFEFKSSLYQSGYFIWPTEADSAVFLHGRNYFNSSNGITLIKSNETDCEFYFFSGCVNSVWLGNFYLNNIDLLEKFILFFKESASNILRKADKNRIIIIKDPIMNQSSNTLNFINNHTTDNTRSDFLKDINSYDDNNKLQRVKERLSNREQEIAHNLLKGRTALETANRLFISRKTVERHVENIKIKLSCANKTELIKNLLVLETF
ncbi:MAG: helix-turn-helix transcriptional regulator [Gammaproteobacteria bacterium]